MGLLDNFFKRRKALKFETTEERSRGLGLLFNTYSGYQDQRAMQLSAFFCAVQLLSNGVAGLPKNIVKYDDDESKQIAHPLWKILNVRPNDKWNPFNLWHDIIMHVIITGNAYLLIQRDSRLNVTGIIPIETDLVTVLPQENGTVKYTVAGINDAVDAVNMLDFAMFRNEMYKGIPLLEYAATTLKSATNAEKTSDNFYQSGAGLSGILKASQTLNKDQRSQIRESWDEAFGGNKGRGIAIIPQGLDFQPVSVNPQDAQLLESRKFNVAEIARFTNVNPILLMDLSEVSYSSMEAVNLYFIQNSVRPYCEMVVSEMNLKLFKPSEVGRIGVKFDYSAGLTANKEAEVNYYRGLITNGMITVNEARKKLGFEAIPAEEGGDSLYMQLSYGTLKDIHDGAYIKTADVDNKLNNKGEDEPKPKSDTKDTTKKKGTK